MITLLELRNRVRQRSDMETSDFVTDAELNGYINSSIAELHDLLVAAYGSDYFLNSHTFTTSLATNDYALPSDFYKMKGVDLNIQGNNWFSVRPFNFNERNRNQDLTWGLLLGPSLRYRIMGGNLKFNPAPDASYNGRIWYVPKATTLVADTDSYDDLNQYAEYVVVDAAIKCLQKEESDVSVLMGQKAALKRRLEEMANNRDEGQPNTISDIYAENNEYWFWRSSN